jgi:penicillin-binding protein 2
MASPGLKEAIHLSRNEFASRAQWGWFDGDTIRTAIGQGYNNYTPAMMARVMAQIANNGARYPLFLVDTVRNHQGNVVERTIPTPDNTGIVMDDSIWAALQEGMLWTVEGNRGGTAVGQFRGFPIQLAGKTGTAEQIPGRLSHSSFGGYAPFNNPQIAIYVTIPFGSTPAMSQIATQIARDVIYAFLVQEPVVEAPATANTIRR